MKEEGSLIRIARQARIIGGAFATEGEFPYQVSLAYDGDFLCGGSILSTLLILTAAHCVKYKRPSRLHVIAGHHDISNGSVGTGFEQLRNARYIYMHENYVWETDVNDIAIIVLNAPLQYSSHVQNISLPQINEEFDGYATVTGWGRTKEKGETSDILKKVKIPIVPNDQCRRLYKKLKMGITDHMMCAGEVGHDSCQGDSGGPAACKKRTNGTAVLCGIISHGHGCGRAGYPGIYTRMSHYVEWIENTKKKIISRGKCRTDQFYCSSGGGCIERTFLCDLETDCPEDLEDERNCAYMASCQRNQFRCNNGRCIKKEWTCDDMDDCGDRSDEDKCPDPSKTCSTGEHQCGVGGRCIPDEWKCDNEQDCDDNSDEDNCGNDRENEIDDTVSKPVKNATSKPTPSPCSSDEFYCARDYRCIPIRWRCDGDRDCRSGGDEINCKEEEYNLNETTTVSSRPISSPGPTFVTSTSATPLSSTESTTSTTPSAPTVNPPRVTTRKPTPTNSTINISNFFTNSACEHGFKCDNGRCINKIFKCDYDNDCGDGSDERDCNVTEATCSQYFWQCGNGQCIYHRFRCDNDTDCLDGSDERGCEQNNSVEVESHDEIKLEDLIAGNNNRVRRKGRRKGRSSRRKGKNNRRN
ncbi:unnamed protein product [Orchesella dallaii]|uniref:Peptidase S1 domain-containing protein n=1 Tax=Orchesella dallaii TaxID=48710 RepID=A0ABP1R7F6_9HEXA